METLAETAYHALESKLVRLELQPGALISEAALCEMLGLGRTPVREAIQRLAAEGLLRALPRKGIIVTEIDIARQLLLLETRAALDAVISRSAARWATPEQCDALHGVARDMGSAAQASDVDTFMLHDKAFDGVLLEAARNPFASAAVMPLYTQCRRFWYAYRVEASLAAIARRHVAFARAVASKDAERAAASTQKLIEHLVNFTKKALPRM